MDHSSLSADDILAIPVTEPERLFIRPDAAAIKKVVQMLSMKWHTDRCSDLRAADVFDRVRKLGDAAVTKLAEGTWATPGVLHITSSSGTAYELSYVRKLVLDIGTMYAGHQTVAFEIGTSDLDLLENAEKQLAGLTYASEGMRTEFARYFPAGVRKIDTKSGAILLMTKAPDTVLLQDVLEHYEGKVPSRHVAWIISRLLNIACYLDRQGLIAHNAIGPDTVFISPATHGVSLLGGWWFAAGIGQKMLAASARMRLSAPPDVLRTKVGDTRTDMEMIKALARELLGDASGVRLASDAAVPSAMVDWLQLSTNQSAVDTYRDWQEHVLPAAFGARKFVEMDVSPKTLYKTGA